MVVALQLKALLAEISETIVFKDLPKRVNHGVL
jgi:hypothetical protein